MPNDKDFRIYHWDTFDNATILIGRKDTLEEAEAFVRERYGDRLSQGGADKVDIVDHRGSIVRQWSVK